jgi:hypothetical protein
VCDRKSQRYGESQCRRTCRKVAEVVAVAYEGGGMYCSVCIECCTARGVSMVLLTIILYPISHVNYPKSIWDNDIGRDQFLTGCLRGSKDSQPQPIV